MPEASGPIRHPALLAVLLIASGLSVLALGAIAAVGDPIRDAISIGPAGTWGLLIGLAFWVGLGLGASALPVLTVTGWQVDTSLAPIMAATALGGPLAGAIVAIVGTTQARELRGKVPWYGVFGNRVVIAWPAITAGFLIDVLGGGRAVPLWGMTIFLAATLAFIVLNDFASSIVAATRSDTPAAEYFRAAMATWLLRFALGSLGWLMVEMAIGVGWWSVLLFGIPLIAVREAYQRIMDAAAADQLRRDKEAAEAASKAKSAFLATMSHEIRTPMNAILGMAELVLASDAVAGEDRESVEVIQGAGRNLLEIINDILDFSKLEAGKVELESVAFDSGRLVREAGALFAGSARKKGLKLVVDIDPAAPTLVGDAGRLRQIVSNLLGNAVKFTSAGVVSLSLSLTGSSAGEGRIEIAVSDTGIGIAPEVARRLFAPFSQADASTTRRFGGSGLGLAISRTLARAMGGEIALESQAGAGSTFTLRLTLPVATEAQLAAANAPSRLVTGTSLAGLRVLVAEDNEANQRVALRMLERLGIDATLAVNGRDAVAHALARPLDVVLMDCHMPELDGFGATRELRAAGFTTPIIALTADAFTGDRDACIAAGMNDYLSKPVQVDALVACLKRVADRVANEPAEPLTDIADLVPVAVDLARSTIDMAAVNQLRDLDPDGSSGFLAMMVRDYLSVADDAAVRIARAMREDDRAELEEAAHRLKGGASTVGAGRVYAIAGEMVRMMRAGDPVERAEGLAAELPRALAEAESALRQLAGLEQAQTAA